MGKEAEADGVGEVVEAASEVAVVVDGQGVDSSLVVVRLVVRSKLDSILQFFFYET